MTEQEKAIEKAEKAFNLWLRIENNARDARISAQAASDSALEVLEEAIANKARAQMVLDELENKRGKK